MFPGNKRYRGLASSSVKSSDKSAVCNYLLQTHGFQARGLDQSDFSMSMKNSLPVNQKDLGGSHFLTADLWTMILLPVLCDPIRAIGPLVSWVFEERRLSLQRKRLHHRQPHRCNCDQRWHKSSIQVVGEENEVNKIPHKKNLLEHFWSNFNTRLIVFSWTHCCQDVNCFGLLLFFLPF